MTGLQVVIGDRRTDMMQVVKADVAGGPLQKLRQAIKRGPFHRHPQRIPSLAACPIDTLELVLHIEEPEAGATGDLDDGQLHQQVSLETNGQTRNHDDQDNRQVRVDHAHQIAFVGTLAGETVNQQKGDDRSQAEQHQGMAIEAVSQAPQPCGRAIFVDSHDPDVAGAAPIEIAGPDVVTDVRPAPVSEGGHSDNAAEVAYVAVPAGGIDEGAVHTIVKDNEDAYVKDRGGQSQGQGDEVGVAVEHSEEHQGQDQQVRQYRVSQLPV